MQIMRYRSLGTPLISSTFIFKSFTSIYYQNESIIKLNEIFCLTLASTFSSNSLLSNVFIFNSLMLLLVPLLDYVWSVISMLFLTSKVFCLIFIVFRETTTVRTTPPSFNNPHQMNDNFKSLFCFRNALNLWVYLPSQILSLLWINS